MVHLSVSVFRHSSVPCDTRQWGADVGADLMKAKRETTGLAGGRENLVDQLEGIGAVEEREVCLWQRVLEHAVANTGGVQRAQEAAVCMRNTDFAENRLWQASRAAQRVVKHLQPHLFSALDFLLIERAQHGHTQARDEPSRHGRVRRRNHVPAAQ